MSDLAIRRGRPDDWTAVSGLLSTVFLDTSTDDSDDSAWRATFEPDRSLVIEDGDEVVAHAGAFTRDLVVPGGPLPAAHVTMVGVVPTHRRRRLLTRMMHQQLVEVPEPVAVLWASEGRIYPRFGYGMAAPRVGFTIDTREMRLPEPQGAGRLVPAKPDKARPELERVFESVWRERPGWSAREGRWWNKLLADSAHGRRGASELRVTLHEGAAGVDGYALWRVKPEWTSTGPQGEVHVIEVVTADPDANLRMWHMLLAVDLTRSATLRLGGLSEPLLHLADEPRRLDARLADGLYLRVVDVPRALEGRRYAAGVDLVLEVTDPLLVANTGRWRLTADPGEPASCVPTDQPADLSCDIVDLGSAYLGGTSLGTLGMAGRVRELRSGALARASAAFGWHRAPAGLEIF
jgi:predicted acetyltransferase